MSRTFVRKLNGKIGTYRWADGVKTRCAYTEGFMSSTSERMNIRELFFDEVVLDLGVTTVNKMQFRYNIICVLTSGLFPPTRFNSPSEYPR